MSSPNKNLKTPNAELQVKVSRQDLPIHCPREGSTLWNSHPRVYIPLAESANGRVLCPYCGTEYIVK